MPRQIAFSILIGIGFLAGCGREGSQASHSSGGSTVPTIETTTFAPELGIDLSTMTKAPSGYWYRDVTVGSGDVADTTKTALVHYVGALPNGKVFDSNGPSDQPFGFRPGAGRVIQGWEEGVPGMRVGGRRLLILPPELGYGARGAGPIPPNSILVFTVDLVALQ